ncbi:MAG: histidine--tRNA ligase, partial [Cyanobacteria bacterium REEB65]|nr:histidine--tRNA ligase [Cyanobacteria bacterium REEB65]
MAEQMSAPRGTRDVLAPEIRSWHWMEAIAREACRRYGYEEIRTPIFEATELFARGIGDETDIVGKEMYTFTDRSGRSLTLRPEGTAGIVRAYLENKLYAGPQPVKLWYQGPMFRYERPQKGRQRQFYQIGAEVFGSAEPTADAEAIALAWTFYQDLFARLRELAGEVELPELVVNLNTLGDEQCRPAYRQAVQDYFRRRAARYCEDCQRRMETNPLRVLDCKVAACGELNRQAPQLRLCEACREHFDAVQEL